MQKYKGITDIKYLFNKQFDNVLPVKVVVQTFAAGMHFLPGTATSRSGELMVYGKKWARIFNDNTPEDCRWWLYPFGIMNYAKYYLDYMNKSKVIHKRYSLMFYVACYFRTIVHILKEVNLIPKIENINPLIVPLDYYTTIIYNGSLNKELLKFVDQVIKRFMKDRSITETIKERYGTLDISNFMKSEIETNETIRQALDEFIVEELVDNTGLLDSIKELLTQ